MLVELFVCEINRCGVDDDIDRSRLSRGIDIDDAGRLFEGASPRGYASEMIHFEAGMCVVRVHIVRRGCGRRRRGGQDEEHECVALFHMFPDEMVWMNEG